MSAASKIYGYARVSAKDQNLARQLDALQSFGVDEVFADKASGKDFERPEYERLVGELREGDVMAVKSIDRLGRNYDEIIEQWRLVTRELGADIVVLDMPLLDTRERVEGLTGKFIADLVLQVLSYTSQVERENIRARQAEGIAAAQARGAKFGRPRIQRPDGCEETLLKVREKSLSKRRAAASLGVSRSTLDRWLIEDQHLL